MIACLLTTSLKLGMYIREQYTAHTDRVPKGKWNMHMGRPLRRTAARLTTKMQHKITCHNTNSRAVCKTKKKQAQKPRGNTLERTQTFKNTRKDNKTGLKRNAKKNTTQPQKQQKSKTRMQRKRNQNPNAKKNAKPERKKNATKTRM